MKRFNVVAVAARRQGLRWAAATGSGTGTTPPSPPPPPSGGSVAPPKPPAAAVSAPPRSSSSVAAPAAAAAAAKTNSTETKSDFSASGVTSVEKILGPLVTESLSFGSGKHVKLVVDSSTFGWIVMDKQGNSANALGTAFFESLELAFAKADEYIKTKKIKMVILTSAKDSFCVGADIDELYDKLDASVGTAASRKGQLFFNAIEDKEYPIIAAVNGLALGGGCELALACHRRWVASDGGSMGLPECMLGLVPGCGGMYRMTKLCGLTAALQWVLTSAPKKSAACLRDGAADKLIPSAPRFDNEQRFFAGIRAAAVILIDKPVPRSAGKRGKLGLMDKLVFKLTESPLGLYAARYMSIKTLNQKTKGKYIAQYKALECLLFTAKNLTNRQTSLEKEATTFGELLKTPESKNLCALYFLENGTKKLEAKTGFAKSAIPAVKKIGVIGAGVMGSGIVHFFANKKFPVAVKDLTQANVDKGLSMVQAEFDAAVKRKKMEKEEAQKRMKLVTGSTSDDIFKDCDVIVEAAVEIMDVKKKLLKSLEEQKILDGKKLFATNTSSLSLTELATASKFPATVVGMHFFNPVSKMPLVEVIKGAKTSAEAAAIIYNLTLQTGKKPIIVKSGPGFLVNRILGVYMSEAGRLCAQDHADPRVVERVITEFGMPMGPFRLLDEVGLDVAIHVGPVLETELKSPRFAVNERIETMVKDGYLGKKNGKGFYKYDKDKEVGINSETLSKYLPAATKASFSKQDILDRCVLLMVNEACHILSEGIAATPEDVDIGMVWGTGFPPFRGGLMQYADHRGANVICDRLKQLQEQQGGDERFAPSSMLVEMAKAKKRFFPSRPWAPYVERSGIPSVSL